MRPAQCIDASEDRLSINGIRPPAEEAPLTPCGRIGCHRQEHLPDQVVDRKVATNEDFLCALHATLKEDWL
jgi:hypothetical protein